MQKFFSHPLVIIAITCLAGLIFFSLEQSSRKADTSQEAIQVEQEATAKLRQELSDTRAELELAGTKLYQEKMIRDELLLQKEGEIVLQLGEMEEAEPELAQEEKKTPWQEWQAVLFR